MAISENVVREWLDEFLHTETKLTVISDGKPLFLQIDSFEIVSLMLACEEKFGLGDSISGDVMTPMTYQELIAFIASRVPA